VLLALGSVAPLAHAVPIDDPLVGGIGFSGPTTGDVAAIYWNPAALALIHGPQVMVSGTTQLSTTTVALGATDPTTGLRGPDVRASDRNHPLTWPIGPGTFAGVAYDVGGDRFTLALATYMPFVERTAYTLPTGGGSSAVRFHRIRADLRNLALVPALAIRLSGELRFGVAPGFLFSTGSLSFDDGPDNELQYQLGSGNGLGSSHFAVTLGLGLYYRRRSWEFGLSFSSRPFGGEVDGAAVVAAGQTQITTPAGASVVQCAGHPDGNGCVFSEIAYKLPWTLAAAATWHLQHGMELTATLRVLSFPSNDVVDIRLTGVNLSSFGVPEHIALYRGYGTTFDNRIRIASWVTQRLHMGAGMRFETAALGASAISPAAVDGPKLEPTAMASFRVVKHLSIGAGYGFTWMLPVSTGGSIFDPSAATACAASGRDITSAACSAVNSGRARPSADGTYHRYSHDFSLSMTAQF
jgi:long-subunit fatty acid transport protein